MWVCACVCMCVCTRACLFRAETAPRAAVHFVRAHVSSGFFLSRRRARRFRGRSRSRLILLLAPLGSDSFLSPPGPPDGLRRINHESRSGRRRPPAPSGPRPPGAAPYCFRVAGPPCRRGLGPGCVAGSAALAGSAGDSENSPAFGLPVAAFGLPGWARLGPAERGAGPSMVLTWARCQSHDTGVPAARCRGPAVICRPGARGSLTTITIAWQVAAEKISLTLQSWSRRRRRAGTAGRQWL